MAQKTTHQTGGGESGLVQRLLDAAESDSVKSVELNINYRFDPDEENLREFIERSGETLEGEGPVKIERSPTPEEQDVPPNFEDEQRPETEEEETDETPVDDEADEEDTSPVTRDTKEEAVMLALYELGESTSTEINDIVGFTSSAKASSTLIRLEEKDMVVRSDAPAGSACQYAFDLSARGRDWIDAFGRSLEQNKYYTGE